VQTLRERDPRTHQATLTLNTLGRLEIWCDGRPVTGLKSRKGRALLVYLALNPGLHSRSRLAGMLWGDLPEKRARRNLRHALWSLRQHLSPQALETTRHSAGLSTDVALQIDVLTFEAGVEQARRCQQAGQAKVAMDHLQVAVGLYGGDFLAHFDLPGCPEFEEWMMRRRVALRQQVREALTHLSAYHAQRGDYEPALETTRRQLALGPWWEEGHRQMMRLLARSGQRGAALAQYETCCRVLAEELGVEPAAETTQLYEQIRDGVFAATLAEATVPMAPPAFLTSVPPHPSPPAPFVARERELARLGAYLDTVLAGQGRVVFVTGDAGRGKTALIQEFARRAQEAYPDLIMAGGNCNAHTGIGDPYLPFREALGLLTGDVEARWAAGAITRERARRLWNTLPLTSRALVEDGPDLIDTFIPGTALVARAAAYAPGGAAWLDRLEELVEHKAVSPSPASPQQSDLFEQYTKVLRALAQECPLLLILDDLQWADLGSISLLFHLGRRLAGSRILILGAYRPEEVAAGRGGERHPLEPVLSEFQRDFGDIRVELGQARDREFLEAFLDSEPNRLGATFRETLCRQTGGHPLFTVELLRGMQERGDLVQDEAGRWMEGPALDWEILPARVEAAIAERIGRLPGELQAALTVASVEGEEFTAEVVAQVRATDEREMVRRLSGELERRHRLVSAQGIGRLGSQRLSRYRFRHYLFQKYLYNSLGEVERAYLHEDVGNVLEALYGEGAEEIAVQLARHFQEAGIPDKAVDYLQQAGNRAVRLSAYEEAIAHLTRGLELLRTLPEVPERVQQELDLQITLGPSLMAARGPATPEVEQTYARARELCRQAGETPQLFPVLRGLYEFYHVRAEYQTALELGKRLLRLAQSLQDPALLVQAHFALGMTSLFMGELVPAQEHLEQVITLYDRGQHRSLAFHYGTDPGVFSRSASSLSLWLLGYPDQALKRSHDALELAQEVAHPLSLAIALVYVACIHQLRREEQLTQERAEAAIALCAEQGFPYWLALGFAHKGWALAEQGEGEEAITLIRQGLTDYWATGAKLVQTWFLARLADAYRKVGQAEEGLAVLTEALALVEKTGERYYEAELYQLKGELLLRCIEPFDKLRTAPVEMMQGESEADVEACFRHAEACFQHAIEVARRQRAKSWELRAVMGLSRLWQSQGKGEQARQLLAEIYGWFTEGFDTPDLQEARMLLEALSC
jgi:DNA-binding SARP family transcriptional activator/predicted ATPase